MNKRLAIGFIGLLCLAVASPVFANQHQQKKQSPLTQFLPAIVQVVPSLLGLTKGLGGSGGGPHPICEAWVKNKKKPPQPPQCTVPSASGMGSVVGVCEETLCKATNLPGGSSPDAGGQALQQILQQLMQKLMQPDQPQPPAGGGDFLGGTGSTTLGGSQYPPCQINPASNTVTSVPCIDSTGALVTNAAWAGGTGSVDTGSGGSSGTAGSIADLLTGSLNSGAGSGGSSSGSGNSASDLLQAITGQTQTQATSSAPNTQVSAQAGAQLTPKNSAGDIVVNKEGVTAVAGTRDQNVEVSGFIGSNTTGLQQSQGATARLCESRPWATGFLSSIIAPSFFDGVCAWRGYNVGPANIPLVTPVYLTPAPRPAKPVVQQQPGVVTVQPASVDIWASPTAVPLGTRTSIFWKAEGGAVSCKVSGPSFTQSGLSGGSATVPISGSSTFTVVCLDASGAEAAKDSVTVTLSI